MRFHSERMAFSFRNHFGGEGHQMTPVRYYRVWIYSVNSLIIVFQTVMVWWLTNLFTHAWWELIPFEEDHPAILALELQIGVQYFACIVGIMGVLFSNKTLLTIYWLLMIPLLFFDVIMAILLMLRMKKVHSEFHDHMKQKIEDHLNEKTVAICSLWDTLQEELNCCVPKTLDAVCKIAWNSPSICADNHTACNANILRWMHAKTDFIGVIIFFVLFPLKLVVVLVLREDIGELFSEIVYSNHAKLYKQWDEDDDLEFLDATPPENNIFAA